MRYEPLISIVIPVYNGSNFMTDAIDSALSQTYKNIEIIVVNDGSTDEGKTEKIALSYGDKIRYYAKKNGGVSSAINLAIHHMKGEWLSWLSHDDMYKPEKLEKQVSFLNKLIEDRQVKNIKDICVYAALERINVDGKFISKKSIVVPSQMAPIDSLIFNIKSYSIGGCTVLMSKEILDEVGGFDESIRTVSDADLWYRMMLAGHNFFYLDEVIVMSRQHKQQVGNRSMVLFEKEHAELMEKITKQLLNVGISKKQKYALAEGLVQNGFDASAQKVFEELKKSGERDIFQDMRIKCCSSLKRKCYVAVRSVYRKLTLK